MNQISKEMKRFNHLLGETNAAYHDAALQLGLSDSAMQILYAVCGYGEGLRCPLQEICRQTSLSKQTIHSSLHRLMQEGILRLEQAGNRNKDVCLTEKGRQFAQKTVARIIETENAIFASWPPEDVEKYLQLTEAFLTALQKKTKTFTEEPNHADYNHQP